MDDRGTPLNRQPTIANKDIDLYRLFNVSLPTFFLIKSACFKVQTYYLLGSHCKIYCFSLFLGRPKVRWLQQGDEPESMERNCQSFGISTGNQ